MKRWCRWEEVVQVGEGGAGGRRWCRWEEVRSPPFHLVPSFDQLLIFSPPTSYSMCHSQEPSRAACTLPHPPPSITHHPLHHPSPPSITPPLPPSPITPHLPSSITHHSSPPSPITPSLHHPSPLPSITPPSPPSPKGARGEEGPDEACHFCPAGRGVWDEGGCSEVCPLLVTLSTAAPDHAD